MALIFLGVSAASAADVAIGQLALGYSQGYQEISFYNLTGQTDGCDGVEFAVCNGITIDNWALALTFTDENSSGTYSYGFVSSPLSFLSNGNSEPIGPFDGVNAYVGGGSGTWEIPLNGLGNGTDEPPCPPCDYELTQVEFSGTLHAADLPLYVGSDPINFANDTSFNAQTTFDTVWIIPVSDYTDGTVAANPAFLGDQTDVLVSDQQSSPSTPEPAGLLLMGGGLIAVGLLKRRHAKDHLSCVG